MSLSIRKMKKRLYRNYNKVQRFTSITITRPFKMTRWVNSLQRFVNVVFKLPVDVIPVDIRIKKGKR